MSTRTHEVPAVGAVHQLSSHARFKVPVVGLLVLCWVGAGLLLGAHMFGYLLLAIPTVLAAQLARRAPISRLWARDSSTFARGRRGKLAVGLILSILVVAAIAERAGTWTDDGWQAIWFTMLLLLGYAALRRILLTMAAATAALAAAGMLLAPGLAAGRSGDPQVLNDLAQQQRAGQLTGFHDLAVAEINLHSHTPVRLAGIGATSNTQMEVGSISKVMTGLLIADAVQRGELNLDRPVSTYLPELNGCPAGGVSLRELVNHSAGYANFGPSVLRDASWKAPLGLNFLGERSDAMMADVRGATLATRGHFEYSSLGAAVAGQALMRVTGMTYSTLMQTRLFGPLGMIDTLVQTHPLVSGGRSASGLPVHPWVLDAYAPAGGVISTTHDLALLATALLSGTAPGLDAMDPIAATDQANTRVGYFWRVSTWQTGQTITWHAGQTGGYDSYLGLDRTNHHAVIVLSDVATEQTTNLGINLLAQTP